MDWFAGWMAGGHESDTESQIRIALFVWSLTRHAPATDKQGGPRSSPPYPFLLMDSVSPPSSRRLLYLHALLAIVVFRIESRIRALSHEF